MYLPSRARAPSAGGARASDATVRRGCSSPSGRSAACRGARWPRAPWPGCWGSRALAWARGPAPRGSGPTSRPRASRRFALAPARSRPLPRASPPPRCSSWPRSGGPVDAWRRDARRSDFPIAGRRVRAAARTPEATVGLRSLRLPRRSVIRRLLGRGEELRLEVRGVLYAPTAGRHRFEVKADDACALAIDGSPVLPATGEGEAVVDLARGPHAFALSFRQERAAASLRVLWDRPERARAALARAPPRGRGGTGHAAPPAGQAHAGDRRPLAVVRMAGGGRRPRGRRGRVQARLARAAGLAPAARPPVRSARPARRGGLHDVRRVPGAGGSDRPRPRAGRLLPAEVHVRVPHADGQRRGPARRAVSIALVPAHPAPMLDAVRAVLARVYRTAEGDALVRRVDAGLYAAWGLVSSALAALVCLWLCRLGGPRFAVPAALALRPPPGLGLLRDAPRRHAPVRVRRDLVPVRAVEGARGRRLVPAAGGRHPAAVLHPFRVPVALPAGRGRVAPAAGDVLAPAGGAGGRGGPGDGRLRGQAARPVRHHLHVVLRGRQLLQGPARVLPWRHGRGASARCPTRRRRACSRARPSSTASTTTTRSRSCAGRSRRWRSTARCCARARGGRTRTRYAGT